MPALHSIQKRYDTTKEHKYCMYIHSIDLISDRFVDTCGVDVFLPLAFDGFEEFVSLEAVDLGLCFCFDDVPGVEAEGFDEVRERVACGVSVDSCGEICFSEADADFSVAELLLLFEAAAGGCFSTPTRFTGGAEYCSRMRFFRREDT